MQSLASLKPSFAHDGRARRLRRGRRSGASRCRAHQPCAPCRQFLGHRRRRRGGAVRLASEAGESAGLKPRASIRAFANIGSEPAIMLTGPVDVTKKVLARSGMSHRRHRPLRDQRGFRLGRAALPPGVRSRPGKVNVNGGAIAMGHPLGATGAMILGTRSTNSSGPAIDGADHVVHRAAWAPRRLSSGFSGPPVSATAVSARRGQPCACDLTAARSHSSR